nr:MAG TPA: hypothetical protein [Caudoviricetes sp.]
MSMLNHYIRPLSGHDTSQPHCLQSYIRNRKHLQNEDIP